jgi:hypothetical protein
MDEVISTLLSTLENELNNNDEWCFGTRKVKVAVTTQVGQYPVLSVTLDDGTRVILHPEVIRPRKAAATAETTERAL